jgi:hypothetical protein
LLRGVRRRSSPPGRCSTTVRSRPTSLPTPCSRSTISRRYRNNALLLVFFVRRLFFAAVVLAALAVIDFGLYRFFRVLIVVVSALSDVVLVLLDPRVRASGRPVG